MFNRLPAVFLACALCGALSRFIYEPDTWRGWLAFPIPFGVLAGWLAARRPPLFVVLAIAVWNAAYQTAASLGGTFLAFSAAGLIGGGGLGLAAGMGDPRALLTAGAVGMAAAWSFLVPDSLGWNLDLAVPFAVWQGAMGVVLVHKRPPRPRG